MYAQNLQCGCTCGWVGEVRVCKSLVGVGMTLLTTVRKNADAFWFSVCYTSAWKLKFRKPDGARSECRCVRMSIKCYGRKGYAPRQPTPPALTEFYEEGAATCPVPSSGDAWEPITIRSPDCLRDIFGTLPCESDERWRLTQKPPCAFQFSEFHFQFFKKTAKPNRVAIRLGNLCRYYTPHHGHSRKKAAPQAAHLPHRTGNPCRYAVSPLVRLGESWPSAHGTTDSTFAERRKPGNDQRRTGTRFVEAWRCDSRKISTWTQRERTFRDRRNEHPSLSFSPLNLPSSYENATIPPCRFYRISKG